MESDAREINIQSGISIRESQVREWLRRKKYKGEYLLVSTKPNSQWSKKLQTLHADTFLIVDLYTPVLLEKALTFRPLSPLDWMNRQRARVMVKHFLERGNHFLVANRRQREYWIVEAKTLGITLKSSDISVLPTGSGLHPSSFILRPSAQRFVVLWFGGIYPWIDPEPLIEGFVKLKDQFPDWKLRFLGGFHPDTGYEHRYRQLMEHAQRLIGKKQLEIVEWQPRGNVERFFQDVAFAVHLTKQTPEDYFAHRVRLLTLLNASIGVLTSGHDVISDLLVKMNAGMRVSSRLDAERMLVKAMHEPERRAMWSKSARSVESTYITKEIDIQFQGVRQ